MSGRSLNTSGTSGNPASSDNNQPMDLAQKSQTARVSEVTNSVKGGQTFVQFGNTQLISSGGSSKSSGLRSESLGVGGGVTLFSRSVSHGALNLASSNSGNSLNSFSSNVSVAARPHPTSSAAVPTSSVPPSGYHIPRGAAAAANMTASRSQNLASIVRTTSQIIGSPATTTLTSPRTSIISQRMVPISNSSWINRNTTTTAVLTTKATSSPVTGRVPVSSGRSSQSPGMPVTTYHGGSVKSGSVVTGTIRPHGASTVRVGATSEGGMQKSMHPSKGITVPHPASHAQKYIGSGATSTIRGVGTSAFITPGNAGNNSNTVYTPTSTLVTSLASSGTTITPHPGNRSQPLNTVRLTSAVTTVFTQASTQANSTSLGGICLTPSSSGTIIAHHSSSIAARNHSVEHLSVKTPIVRTSHPSVQSHGIKGSASGLPVGTHISISGPKVISQPTQVPTLALAQLSNVAGPKPPGAVITTQTGLTAAPFQSRTGSMVTPPVARSGPTISMAKVIPQVKGAVTPCLSTSLPTITASPASLTSVTSVVGQDSQSPHSSVFVHRPSHNAPMTTGTTGSQGERSAPTLTHYSIATPYYLDSNQTSFPVSASIVPANHYIPSTGSSGTIRVSGNGAMNNATTTSEGNNHQGISVPIIKTNSSPRPSILRKRSDIESGVPLKAAKNLSAALNIPLTSPPSPIRPDSRGNGNISSGSSTVSANSSPGLQLNEEDSSASNLKMSCSGMRGETPSNENVPPASCVIGFPLTSRPMTTNANDHTVVTSSLERGVLCAQNSVPFSLSIPQVMEGMSPRKKPRKQQLMGNELHEVRSGEDEFENHIQKKIKKEPLSIRPIPLAPESEEEKETSVEPPNARPESWRETTPSPEPVLKIPHMSLMNSYRQTWKARHNHFFKHAEVRPKEEKKRTVNEIANQKLAMQRVNGWKVMHLLGQVEDLSTMEGDVKSRLQHILGAIEKRQQQKKPYKDFDKDVNRLSELVKANIQRSVIIKDQMGEAKVQMNKIFTHKDNIVNILTKYGNTKRNLRKKERL